MIPPTGVAATAAPRALGACSSCFVYGTLMSREVVEGLVGRCPDMKPALLPGHRRHPVVGQVYPGMISNDVTSEALEPREAGGVRGMLLTGIRPHELERFDWFEDVDNGIYKRVSVNILAPSDSKAVKANTDDRIMAPSDQMVFTNSSDARADTSDIKDWEEVQTSAYIISTPSELDMTKCWSYERFRGESLGWYLTNTVAYCKKELDDSGIGI